MLTPRPPESSMADFVSPFASSFVQQQGAITPPAVASIPPEPSRSNSPVRVVGFDKSPTSVVVLRRWQSAAESSTATVMDAAAEGGGSGGDGSGSGCNAQAPVPPMGFGRAPKSRPIDGKAPKALPLGRQCSLGRHSSLGTLLKQQEQLTQLQKRLSIITGRSPTSVQSPPGAGGSSKSSGKATDPSAGGGMCRYGSVPQTLRSGTVPAVAAVVEDLEQDWMAALTPDSSKLKEVAAVAAAPAAVVPAALPPATASPSQLANPFAAAAHVAFDVPEEHKVAAPLAPPPATLPAGGGHGALHAVQSPSYGRTLVSLQRHGSGALGMCRQGSGMMRQNSASINIPSHRMRRAETAPALTDDIIAAAVALAEASNPSAASSKLTATAVAGPGASVAASSDGSSYTVSPSLGMGLRQPLHSMPEQQASATREVFEAQAEAVAAQTQSKVLQQALALERQRADQLERQVRSMLRERAEEKAARQAHEQWFQSQQQQMLAQRQMLSQQQEQLLVMQLQLAAQAAQAAQQHQWMGQQQAPAAVPPAAIERQQPVGL